MLDFIRQYSCNVELLITSLLRVAQQQLQLGKMVPLWLLFPMLSLRREWCSTTRAAYAAASIGTEQSLLHYGLAYCFGDFVEAMNFGWTVRGSRTEEKWLGRIGSKGTFPLLDGCALPRITLLFRASTAIDISIRPNTTLFTSHNCLLPNI